MPMPEARVFISYAHEDARWFDETGAHGLIPWLRDSLRRPDIAFWYDPHLQPGEEWRSRILEEIARSHVVLLLVSESFLSSDFIKQVELPAIQARVEQGQAIVLPLLLEPCNYQENAWVCSRQMLPAQAQPLTDFIESDQQWAHVRYEILQAVKRAALRRTAPVEAEVVTPRTMPGDSGPAALTEKPAPRLNLPVQPTSFVGRKQELADLSRLLETTHLLTLTGAGGCGKTRLALEAAGSLVERFAEGVWLVQLASLSDPGLVANQVAIAVGLNLGADQDPLEKVKGYLATRSVLLLLDNCEHLLEGAATVAEGLLTSCPGSRILATSRTPLRVAGEQIYRVPPLSLPEPGSAVAKMTEAKLRSYDAVSLFLDRARAAQPSFQATGQNAATLTELCRRLDGIPLAIELAAARLSALPLEEIAKRLEDRFRLLTAGSRAALPRHQTLRALIDWSFDLLTETQQALLMRLSVFAGAWTFAAAEAMCSGEGVAEEEVIGLVADLVDNSLVVPVTTREGEGRFRLLETVRQYAAEELETAGETQRWRDRHYAYFSTYAEQWDGSWMYLGKGSQLAELPAMPFYEDRYDFRVALEHASSRLTVGNLVMAQSLAEDSWVESLAWLRHLMAADDGGPSLLRGDALICMHANLEGAERRMALEEALRIFREIGDKRRLCEALSSLHRLAVRIGEEEMERQYRAELWAEASASEDPVVHVGAQFAQVLFHVARLDTTRARPLTEDLLALCRREGLAPLVTYLGYECAHLAYVDAEYARARFLIETTLADSLASHHIYAVQLPLRLLGDIARAEGHYSEARSNYRACMAGLWDCGDLGFEGELAMRLGCLLVAESRLADGVRLIAAAERIGDIIGRGPELYESRESEPALAAARDALGEEAFQQAWAEGQALPQEAALALCRAELERLEPAPGTPTTTGP
jgi:predicted ATPase